MSEKKNLMVTTLPDGTKEEVEAQIKALYANGLNGGYMTWNAYSYKNNLPKYKNQKGAYSKEYK